MGVFAFAAAYSLLQLADLADHAHAGVFAVAVAAVAFGWAATGRQKVHAEPTSVHPDAIADSLPGFGWLADTDGRITGLSAGFRERFGPGGYGETCFFEHILHSDDREEAAVRWRRASRTGMNFQGTYRFRGADGVHLWCVISARAERDRMGGIGGWIGTLVDVNALKAEATSSASEMNMRAILDNIPAMISTATANGRQEYNNRTSVEFHGKDFDKLNGTQFLESIHPDDREGFIAARLHCMENALPMDRRSRVKRHDGTYRWIQTRSQPVLDRSGNVVRWYGITMDIDDQVRAEEALYNAQEQLVRASHLTTLAELSASIAHEVNQPLAAVVTNSHACRAWLSTDPPNLPRARVAAERMVRDSMAAAAVVSRIRALFARKDEAKIATDLRDIVQEVRVIMAAQFAAEGTSIALILGPDPLIVLADRVQIQQVFTNLFRNAIDAMKSNGATPKSISVALRRAAGQTILVEVADTGIGVADPAGIFEPFFTTKKDGMGMGLAICRSIIEAHDGTMWVRAHAPQGAVFSFRLPAVDNGGE